MASSKSKTKIMEDVDVQVNSKPSKTVSKKSSDKNADTASKKGSKTRATKDILKKKKKAPSKDAKWYVLYAQSNYENSVAKAIKQRVEATETEDLIVDVFVPTQKKIVVKKGKQTVKEERIFPGYVLIKMVLNPDTWGLISATEGVRGFVKTDRYPRPLPEKEVQAIMKFMEIEQPSYQVSFTVDEAVKIIDGAFADFIGSVKEIDTDKGKVTVMISFLGREAPVELDFNQVEKL